MQKITFLFISLLLSSSAFSQIVINEICPANDAVISDEDGDFEDWIELYNPTNNILSLNKYKFVYEEADETAETWIFPKDAYIKPKSHMLIFTSEKDRKEVVDHWEVPAFADSIWRYKVNTVLAPDTDWYQPYYTDLSWQQGLGGFGYGDNDDNTNVVFANSVYVRKKFFISDTSKYLIGFLMIDYDDSFVAFLNGVEIARSNIGAYGDHPAYNASAYEEHEAQFYQGGGPEFYFIPKQLMRSTLVPGNNVLAIQVNNYSSGTDDLSLLPWLIIGRKDSSQTFPSFPADFFMHTNFSLSNTEGFTISLKDSLGNVIDKQTVQSKSVQVNNSRGRATDGASTWTLFYFTTPNDTNDFSPPFSGYTAEPSFNLPGGFYSGTQTVTITSPPGTVVFYSLNGNNPTPSDIFYTGPIIINSTKLVRARAFDTTWTNLMSQTITNTYFINENISLPVISLALDSLSLWDDTTGIYVMGPNASPVIPYQNANFWMDWKKQGHTEYFTKNKNLGFEQDCALGIHGNFSRSWPQKSFRVYANDDYMDPYINYKIFPDKDINKFRSFNIRNAGIDWNTCHFRDRLMHKLVMGKTDIDMMDGEPVVLFLNGQYWGVYESRERQDEYYLAENHNVDPDNVDLLRFEGDILEGSNAAFYNMVAFMYFNDMTIQANYDSALKLIDVENYCDYFIAETFYNNYDWIWIDDVNKSEATNNIKFWRTINPASKWRYILWDTDLGMSLFDGTDVNCPHNLFGNIIDSSILIPSYHVIMLRAMLSNSSFKNYFVNRYCDLMNTIYYPGNVIDKIHKLRDEMMPEMARQFTKWNGPITIFGQWTVGRSTDVPSWLAEIDTLETFANCRPYSVRDSLQSEFGLTKQVDVTIDVSPLGAGNIKLNSINKLDSLPWTGIYFDGVPVTMTATASVGYKFSHWQSPLLIPSPDKNTSVTINITQNETFTAYFEKLELDFSVYPNPFTDGFSLTYEIPKEMQASVIIYDMLGRQVAEIVSGDNLQKEGTYRVNVGTDRYSLSSGIYFIKFTAGEFSKTIKILKTND